MLAVSYLFQQGTPFIYQGQEIGMTNIRLSSIDQYVDVVSIYNYHAFHTKDPEEKRMHRIHLASRDSARTPVQWDNSDYAGFSSHKPWFAVNPNYRLINVAAEEADSDSILHFYRKCLALRKHSKTLLYGAYREYFPKDDQLYVYERAYGSIRYLMICSFSHFPVKLRIPKAYAGRKGQLVLCNYAGKTKDGMLRPYEARVYRFRI